MDSRLLARELIPLLPELTCFARWLVGSQKEADDLTQDVVLRALEHAADIKDPTRLRAWLFRTARNARVDGLRASEARARLTLVEGGLEDLKSVTLPADPGLAILDRMEVENALAKLPEPARVAVLLVDLWQFSYEEVASILDVPMGTVRSRVARARAHLAQLLLADATTRATGGDWA